MNLYALIRRLHLFSALVVLGFVVMYFLTGVVMLHRNWFPVSPAPAAPRIESLPALTDASPEAVIRHLQGALELRGRPAAPVRRRDGSQLFVFAQPRVSFDAVVSSDLRQVTITRRDYGFAETVSRMHHLRGFQGGWAYFAWAWFYDLASVALIIFAVTGIYLWYRSTPRRWLGAVFLATGTILSFAMIGYFVWRS